MVALRDPCPEDDAPLVARIYIESWNKGFGHLMGVRELTPDQATRWQTELARPDVNWTVAELDGAVVGFVGVGPSRDPIDATLGELNTIAVDARRWRQGVGRALMDHALDRLRATWSQAILWTPTGYDRGHAFYRTTGWHELDQTRANGTEVALGHNL